MIFLSVVVVSQTVLNGTHIIYIYYGCLPL
jgi:hypothetical protein